MIWPKRLTTAVLAFAAAAAAVATFSRGGPPAAPATSGPAAGTDLSFLSPQAQLLAIAQQLQPTPADSAAAGTAADPPGWRGGGSCVRVQRQVESSGDVVVSESVRWMRPNGAGTVVERRARIAADGSVAASTALRKATPVTSDYGPGGLPSPVGDPVPADPAVLAERIAARTPATATSAATIAVLVDLAATRYLDIQQRAALLRVLATLPGLTAAGRRNDPAGRDDIGAGITIVTGEHSSQITFTIDPASGRLLRAETTDASGGRQTTLLLDSSRCNCLPADLGGPGRWRPFLLRNPVPASAIAGRCPRPQTGTPHDRAAAGTPGGRP